MSFSRHNGVPAQTDSEITASKTKSETRGNWTLVVHGGAVMSPEQDDAKSHRYHAGLSDALVAGRRILASGGAAIDAVQTAVVALENNPLFNAGRGAVARLDGSFQLDACLMDGSTGHSGAVAAVQKVTNPILAAGLVMHHGQHRLLVGPGADQFAIDRGCSVVSERYFIDEQNLRDAVRPSLGTVGAVAMDRDGNLAAGTSTGGVTHCLPGRVGDSPIVGAGTFAENGTVAVSATGFGERFLRHSAAAQVAWMIRHLGCTANEAMNVILTEVLPNQSGGMIGVSGSGDVLMHYTTQRMRRGWANNHGAFQTAVTD
jgi:beta-aspartyl-peptidase (threonine type)